MTRSRKLLWTMAVSLPISFVILWLSACDRGNTAEAAPPRTAPPSSQAAERLGGFQSLGPGGGGAVFAAVFHNTDPSIILVGQDMGGIAKSTDGGATWRHVNQGGISVPSATNGVYWISEIVAHPTDDDVFFACTGHGLFRSEDVGETWAQLLPTDRTDVWGLGVSWLAFSPTTGHGLLGTGDWHEPDPGEGVYRSTDGGRTFGKVSAQGIPQTASINAIAFDPSDGSAYATTTSGLYRSADEGDTFTRVAHAFRHARGQWVGIGGTGDARVFWYVLETLGRDGSPATWSGGVYRSTDGTNWSEVPGLQRRSLDDDTELMRTMGARIHPNNPDRLFLNLRTKEGQGATYRYDGAWTNLTASFQNRTWNDHWEIAPEGVAISPTNPDQMISVNEIANLKSDDEGATWQQLSIRDLNGSWSGTGAEVTVVYDVALSQGSLYAGFEDIGLWRSDDRGASWKHLLWPEEADGGTQIEAHPTDPDRVYLSTGSWSNDLREDDVVSKLYRSMADGVPPVDISPPTAPTERGRPAFSVAWGALAAEDTLYVAFHGDTIYQSSDGGATWSEASSGLSAANRQLIYDVAFDAADPTQVYAGLNGNYDEFTTQGGLYRTRAGDAGWSRVDGYPYQDVASIRFVGSPPRLFVGGWTYNDDTGLTDGGLMVSDDGTLFTEVLGQPFVFDVIDVPGEAGTLYAAASSTYYPGQNQYAGIYVSRDNGDTWARLRGSLPHNHIWSLVVFPDQPGRILMGTNGDGVIAAQVERKLYLPAILVAQPTVPA